MKRHSEVVDLFVPWSGLVIGLIALSVAHQFGSDGTFDHCRSISPIPLSIVSILAIAATVAGAFASWGVFSKEAETPTRKIIAAISMGTSAFFILAMIFPIIAAWVIPSCFQ